MSEHYDKNAPTYGMTGPGDGGFTTYVPRGLLTAAKARIAELEADAADAKDAATSRLDVAEVEADRLRTLLQKAKAAMIRAEAALAEMPAPRCETCEHADKNGDPWGCRANMLLFPKPAEYCNRWREVRA